MQLKFFLKKSTKLVFTGLIVFQSYLIIAQHKNYNKAAKLNNLGFEAIEAAKYDKAITYFNKAIAIDSTLSVSFHNRAFAYSKQENHKEALKSYQLASKLEPKNSEFYYYIANCFQKLETPDSAITYYTLAIEADKTGHNAKSSYFNRGNIYLKKEKYEAAIEDYSKVILYDRAHYGAYNNRAIAYYKMDNKENACKDWEHAYKNGLFTAGHYLEKNCNKDLSTLNEKVQNDSHKTLPVFPGGNLGLRKFVAMNVTYPQNARAKGVVGKVIIGFLVTKNGAVDSFKVLNDVHPQLNKSAIDAIKKTNGMWKPGKISGKDTNMALTVPIIFKTLSDKPVVQYKNKANQLFSKGDYPGALIAYNEVIRREPENIFVLEMRAKTKEKLGDLNGAEKDRSLIEYGYTYYQDREVYKNRPKENTKQKHLEKKFDVTLLFDSVCQLTFKPKADFYRKAVWRQSINYFDGPFTDYTRSDSILSKGSYKLGAKSGAFSFYYPNGKIKAKAWFKGNLPDSTWRYYYSNGQLMQVVNFSGNQFEIAEYYDQNGNMIIHEGNGNWAIQIENWDKTLTVVSGQLLNGKREGEWKVVMDNKLLLLEDYKNGKLKKGVFYDDGKKVRTKKVSINSWLFIPTYMLRCEKLLFAPGVPKTTYEFIHE
jgi:TonB family protein